MKKSNFEECIKLLLLLFTEKKTKEKMGNPPKRVVLSKLIRRYFKRQGGIEAS